MSAPAVKLSNIDNVPSERLLKLLFTEKIPDQIQNNKSEVADYLNLMGTFKVDQLKREQSRLASECSSILEQTQDLAISNYKTFIHTAEKTRCISSEFQNASSQVDGLMARLPEFGDKCGDFLEQSNTFSESRRMNSLTLKKSAKLLEILELPQIMERCIRENRYEEALELASYVQKMDKNQGHIPLVKNIVKSVESLWRKMLDQLVNQLRTDLQLSRCLQIVGYLRRMQAFTSKELRLKFLQARNTWYGSTLDSIPKDDAQQYLNKIIEVTRVNLFNVITQYRAIFPDEHTNPASDHMNMDLSSGQYYYMDGISCNGDRLFQSWIHRKIALFLDTLKCGLSRDISSLDGILGQCMYFGLSFSRVGVDFRGLMVPIFMKVIFERFITKMAECDQRFKQQMEKFTLINKVALYSRAAKPSKDSSSEGKENSDLDADLYSPPESLLDFYPLACLCNDYLNTFNDLRLCAPTGLSTLVTQRLQMSLSDASELILAFYKQEQQAFTVNERNLFNRLCSSFAYDLLPYLQKCLEAIFPPKKLCVLLGINQNQLKECSVITLDQKLILTPLKHLMPNRIVDVTVDVINNKSTSTTITEDAKV